MFAGLLATSLTSLENIDILVLDCGLLLCKVLKVTYASYIW